MSAQSRATGRQAGRTSVLEGESSGPSYGAAEPEGGSRQSVVLPNGVTSRRSVVETDAGRMRAEGPFVGPTGSAATGQEGNGVSGLGGLVQQDHSPAQQPQHSTEQQQRQEHTERQQQASASAGIPPQYPEEPVEVHVQEPRPTLVRHQPLHDEVQQRAHESVLRRELVQEVHVRQAERAFQTEDHGGAIVEPGGNRPAWFARVSEVVQRRIVSPVMEQVQSVGLAGKSERTPEASPHSVWHSQPATPTTMHPQPLMTQEVRQAMSAWTSRPSLLTPKPRRPAEESSNASLSQEVIMEEVRKQVKTALDERESEMKRLSDENRELRQAVFELSNRELGSGARRVQEQGTLMDGGPGLRGAEPRGNPGPEHQGAVESGWHPPGLPAQSSVPGGEPLGGEILRAPPGLARPEQREGELGSPAGLPAQSSVPDGNPPGHDDSEGGHKSRKGPTGASGHGDGIQPDEHAGPGAGAASGEDNAMVDHLHLLVQGMRQLQQLQMNRKDHTEAEAVKGGTELQKMPEPGDAAVEFNDWMYITEQQLGALTDNASAWFGKCLTCAREAYVRYQGSSALERLSVVPELTEELRDQKWFRLERRVLSLLLAAMPKAVREDTITHRVESVAGVLFRLHVIYQPGGAMERTAILKHLEGSSGTDDPGDVVTQLRRWRRYLARAEEMSITLPDASLQLRGIELITARVLEKYSDVKFRLALAKNDLRLSSAPTAESVLKYYQHALAELQQVAPNVKGNSESAKLKGANATTTATPGTGGSGSPTTSPKRGKNPCKFFQSEAGCKRGASCTYAHEFLNKADRKSRCWTCGGVGHRQQACPTTTGEAGKGSGKQQQTSSTTSAPNSNATAARIQAPPADTTPMLAVPLPEAGSSIATTSTATSSGDESAAQREEMKKLLKEASAMLSKIQLMTLRIDDTNKATEDLDTLLRSAGMDQHGLALLDSGASHPFRNPVNEMEFDAAKNVGVELADGQTVKLRQTRAGTLLKDGRDQSPQAPIVPLGCLVQQLGCTISWSRRQGLHVVHPTHGSLKVKMKGSCPYISEMEALKLIAEIEDKSLEQLQETTMRSLWASSMNSSPVPWTTSLGVYVDTGARSSALAAMMDPNFPLSLETETERYDFVGPTDLDLSDKAGQAYLKALPVNRRVRRRLQTSRWIIHLYDGKNVMASEELKKLEGEGVTVLEIDIQRSKIYNMKGWGNVLRALLWAGCRGQIDGILGGPPKGDDELRQKLVYLWMVAEKGAEKENLRKPFLFMQYPEAMDWWKNEEWSRLRSEYFLLHVCVDAGDTQIFHGVSNMSFMNYLREPESGKGSSPTRWTARLLEAVVEGINDWHKWPDQVRQAHLLCRAEGPLDEMSEKDLKRWARHVRDGHVPFHKRCRTCVMNAGSGRQHRRVLNPSSYVLSVDVAGPFRSRGIDADGKYRYALIGSYCMPKLPNYKEPDLEPQSPEEGDDGGGVGPILPGDDRGGGESVLPGDDRGGGDSVLPGDDRGGGDSVLPGDDRGGGDSVLPGDDRGGGDFFQVTIVVVAT